MAIQNDPTIHNEKTLLRVLDLDPSWTTNKGGRYRPSSLAFFQADGEVSYFVDSEGIVEELRRIFPGREIARVSASVIRSEEVGLAIACRPEEVPADFRCDPNSHVVVGPPAEMTRLEFQRRARAIAKHHSTAIIPRVQIANELHEDPDS
jgi:hypothetical protein